MEMVDTWSFDLKLTYSKGLLLICRQSDFVSLQSRDIKRGAVI